MSKKEGRYYVEYLGWKETRGLHGSEFTEPIVRELLARRRHNRGLPRMTIKVNRNEVQISQEVSSKSNSKPQKVKYPAMPIKDIAFVVQSPSPDKDIVACIFLGYNPYTKCATHAHAYRFDSENTASMFVHHLRSILDSNEYKERISAIEKDLCELGHITIRKQERPNPSDYLNGAGSDGFSHGTPSPHSSDGHSPKYPSMEDALRQRADINIVKSPPAPEPDRRAKKIFSSLQEELEHKLALDEVPILLPAKDYDTIVRRYGRLSIRDQVKSKERSIVGPNGIFAHMEAEPYIGTVDDRNSEGKSEAVSATSSNSDLNSPDEVQTMQRKFSAPQNNGIARSQSDTQANLGGRVKVRRQHSQASSDRGSGLSDDSFAEGMFGVYQGFKSKGKSKYLADDEMFMWSPQFSFGQAGAPNLPSHAEEDDGFLARTAPAGYLRRHALNGNVSYGERRASRPISNGRKS